MEIARVTRDSVSTTSENGKRIPVFPAEVKGKWNTRRTIFQWGMIAIYLVLPWIKVGGHPLIQLDIEHRRFSIFGQLFFAQEVPNLVFLTLSFLLLMGLLTAWFGRVWCGWACPQTVFIERLFRWVERRIEGNPQKQRSLYSSEPSLDKIAKRVFKWGVFVGIALILSHSFLAYFVGSEASYALMTRSPMEHPKSFFLVMLFSGVVLFDFGWFREQFCLVACPYGRFQSVMMDESSLFIHYDKTRTDCIDCNKCVAACPTGIDIRNGLQMECIACTSCADACDSVMKKIHKPLGLVAYQSLRSISGMKSRFFRIRPMVYLAGLVLCLAILGHRLSGRTPFSVEVTRAIDTPYQVLTTQDGSKFVLNHFRVYLNNRGWSPLSPGVSLPEVERASGVELIIPPGSNSSAEIQTGEAREFDLFLKVPLQVFQEKMKIGGVALLTRWSETIESNTLLKLIGPEDDL
jgi:cytochrome c oxidase accessory protein FixG